MASIRQKMQLNVKFGESVFTVSAVRGKTRIADIREKLDELSQQQSVAQHPDSLSLPPYWNQDLLFQGKRLADNQVVDFSFLRGGDTVELLVRRDLFKRLADLNVCLADEKQAAADSFVQEIQLIMREENPFFRARKIYPVLSVPGLLFPGAIDLVASYDRGYSRFYLNLASQLMPADSGRGHWSRPAETLRNQILYKLMPAFFPTRVGKTVPIPFDQACKQAATLAMLESLMIKITELRSRYPEQSELWKLWGDYHRSWLISYQADCIVGNSALSVFMATVLEEVAKYQHQASLSDALSSKLKKIPLSSELKKIHTDYQQKLQEVQKTAEEPKIFSLTHPAFWLEEAIQVEAIALQNKGHATLALQIRNIVMKLKTECVDADKLEQELIKKMAKNGELYTLLTHSYTKEGRWPNSTNAQQRIEAQYQERYKKPFSKAASTAVSTDLAGRASLMQLRSV